MLTSTQYKKAAIVSALLMLIASLKAEDPFFEKCRADLGRNNNVRALRNWAIGVTKFWRALKPATLDRPRMEVTRTL